MSNPKISVIIPVYNGKNYIEECLDSIINQTLKEIEIICVNDGSTDNSLEILEKYHSKDDRIKIVTKENEGQGYARKVGLDNATGTYIMFCDQDDKFASNDSFQIAFDRIEKYNTDIVIFKFAYWDEENIRDIYGDYKPKSIIFRHIEEKYLLFHWFAPWLKIYRKSFLDNYDDWYFPKFTFIEDPPFHVQILIRANSITFIDKILYLHRTTNPKSITNRKKYTNKHALAFCNFNEKIKDFLILENALDEYQENFVYFITNQSFSYILASDFNLDSIITIQKFLKKNIKLLKPFIVNYSFHKNNNSILNRKEFFYLKSMIRFSDLKVIEYLYKKYKYVDKKNIEKIIEEKNGEIQNLQDNLQRLQNSWSYRIGRFFTYPLSIPLDFYRYIRDYNLIKKSGLFDSEYYLAKNEDVKKAKMDPIKHYLKFGWKEGRNPSAEFNTNEYLKKRTDVRIAGICPIVHYIQFGKFENI